MLDEPAARIRGAQNQCSKRQDGGRALKYPVITSVLDEIHGVISSVPQFAGGLHETRQGIPVCIVWPSCVGRCN